MQKICFLDKLIDEPRRQSNGQDCEEPSKTEGLQYLQSSGCCIFAEPDTQDVLLITDNNKTMGVTTKIVILFLAITCLVAAPYRSALRLPKSLVTALRGMHGRSGTHFAAARWTELEFKSSDDSRGRTWPPDQGFESFDH